MTGARIGDWTRTASGRRFYPLDPRPEDFCIEDVATGLSNICRWSGQIPDGKWISVAEHSLMVASLVPPELALQALLHDATEAYLGDIATPIKRFLPDYQEIEDRVWAGIAEKFLIPLRLDARVKEGDALSLLAEAEFLFGPGATDGWKAAEGRKAPPISIRMLPPAAARNEFLRTFEMLVQQGQPRLAELAAG